MVIIHSAKVNFADSPIERLGDASAIATTIDYSVSYGVGGAVLEGFGHAFCNLNDLYTAEDKQEMERIADNNPTYAQIGKILTSQ